MIFSSLRVVNRRVYSTDTRYNFRIAPDHDIPKGGSIRLTFPDEVSITNDVVVDPNFPLLLKSGNILLLEVKEATNSDIPFLIKLRNIPNVRSMRPTQNFNITTFDSEGYTIDTGGQDIIIRLTDFAYFESVNITNLNQLNGAITSLAVDIRNEHPMIVGDTLHL